MYLWLDCNETSSHTILDLWREAWFDNIAPPLGDRMYGSIVKFRKFLYLIRLETKEYNFCHDQICSTSREQPETPGDLRQKRFK